MVKDGGTKGYLVYSESKEEEKEIKEGSRLNGKKKWTEKKAEIDLEDILLEQLIWLQGWKNHSFI